MKNKCLLLLLPTLLLTAPCAVPDQTPSSKTTTLSAAEITMITAIQARMEKANNVKEREAAEVYAIGLTAPGGSPKMLRYLKSTLGIDISRKNVSGVTALHLAAENGNEKLVRFLIEEEHFNPDAENNLEETPLHYAAISQTPRGTILCLVKDHNANLSAKNKRKQTPLMVAIQYRNTEALRCFKELGKDWMADDVTKLAVIDGGLKGDAAFNKYAIDTLLREGSVSPGEKGVRKDEIFSSNLLRIAIKSGDTNAIAQVIRRDPSGIEKITPSGALEYAVMYATAPATRYFLETYRLKPVAKGSSPTLCLSAGYGNVDVVQYLIEEWKMNPAEKNSKGFDAFDCALDRRGNPETVAYLIEKQGMDINRTNSLGRTALLQAVSEGNLDIVKHLLDVQKANPYTADGQGKTIFQLSGGNTTLFTYLLQKYNPKNKDKVLAALGSISAAKAAVGKAEAAYNSISRDEEYLDERVSARQPIDMANKKLKAEYENLALQISKLRFQ